MCDLEEIPYCDIFYPTDEEFKDFEKCLEKYEKLATSGIIKIVPPKSFKARKDNYKDLEFQVPHPIEQIVTGDNGAYELFLLQKESRLLSKYRKLVSELDKRSDSKTPLDIEKTFWKTLKFNAPLYGADLPGSLFDKGVNWNLSELNTVLTRGLDGAIIGVTNPYLYVGSWKAMFAWHKEDMDLFSINYLHQGKPKCWYGIPPSDAEKFDELAKKYYPDAYQECPEFLRHKTYMIYPPTVKKNNITVHKCLQQPGEFVVTFGKAYHAGFNLGYNIAEAVNFALKSWIEIGKKAHPCKCIRDSVKINMGNFVQKLNNNPVCIFDDKSSKQTSEVQRKSMTGQVSGRKRSKSKTDEDKKRGRKNQGQISSKTVGKRIKQRKSFKYQLTCNKCQMTKEVSKGSFQKYSLSEEYECKLLNLTCYSTGRGGKAKIIFKRKVGRPRLTEAQKARNKIMKARHF